MNIEEFRIGDPRPSARDLNGFLAELVRLGKVTATPPLVITATNDGVNFHIDAVPLGKIVLTTGIIPARTAVDTPGVGPGVAQVFNGTKYIATAAKVKVFNHTDVPLKSGVYVQCLTVEGGYLFYDVARCADGGSS